MDVQRRADIQGLRALAVLAVVAFHAGLPLPGGFVGVDVFFVVSGYVITSMLRREWAQTGRVSFSAFYLRRFKRLAPALSLVVAFTVLASGLVLSPLGPQEDVARTGVGALFSVANWVIASTTGGYFDRPAGANPLLHTWSLSVEEQFYLLFPALLVLGWRFRRAGSTVAVVAVASFAATLVWHGFYDPFMRAWEFGAGALVVLAPQLRSTRIALLASAAGLELLLLSVSLIGSGTPFPGAWTLLPVAAAALLLLGGTSERSPLTRLLGARPLAALGDRSYSIYLWHWPLIVFAVALWPSAAHVRAYAAAASLVPALLCFAYVEQPLRRMRAAPARRLALIAVAVVALPFAVDGAMASTVTGVWSPGYRPTDLRVAHRGAIGEAPFYRYLRAHFPTCPDPLLRRYALEFDRIPRCAQSRAGANVDLAVIGDSHAEHLFVGLAEALPAHNVLYDIVDDAPTVHSAAFARIVQDVAARHSVHTVVLNAYWYIRAITRAGDLVPTLRALQAPGRRVFVTDDVPAFPFDAFACKYRKAVFVASVCTDPLFDVGRAYGVYAGALATAVAAVPGTHLIHTYHDLCTGPTCAMTHNGRLLYRDGNHLNVDGSRFLAGRMLLDPLFARATAGPRPRPR